MSPRFGLPKGRRGRGDRGEAADKESAAYWRELKSGDFVGLSDAEAFEASLASGAGSGGSVDYEVGEVRRFALRGSGGGLAGGGRGAGQGGGAEPGSYAFVELKEEGSGPLYLVLVDPEPSSGPEPGSGTERFELRLYFTPAGIEGGTRDDWIDRGDSWLFLPPPDPEDFLAKDLEYAPYPDLPPVDGRKLVFSRVGAGEQYAEALDNGAPSIIVEYEAEASGEGGSGPENPLLLLLEEGWMRLDGREPEEGGYLTLMLGKRLKPGDLEYWPS